jgi:hypothetical protein
MSENNCIRPICGTEGYYADSEGVIYKRIHGVLQRKRTSVSTNGYDVTTLTVGGSKRQYRVSRLVLLAFVGQPQSSHEACHNNGNPRDNRICNLRWDTKASNQQDRQAHGTSNRGVRNGRAKLSEQDVSQIRGSYPASSQRELANRFGVSKRSIAMVVNHISFKEQQ